MLRVAKQEGEGDVYFKIKQISPIPINPVVVPKAGSFTRCAAHQHTHRAEALPLLRIGAGPGAGWSFHRASTPLSRGTRNTYSYQKKEEIPHYIPIGSSRHSLS